jgi:hypothetical protein
VVPAQPNPPLVSIVDNPACRGKALTYTITNQTCNTEYTWRADDGDPLGTGGHIMARSPNGATQFCVNVTATNTMTGLSTTARYCFDLVECTERNSIPNSLIREKGKKNILRLIPSPASDELTIECSESGWMKAQIINTLGQVMAEIRFKDRTTKLDVSRLIPGSYTVLLVNEDGITTAQPLLIAR